MRFKEIELKDICLDMHQGINTVADKVEYKNEGIPIIQSKNITSGYLDLEDVRYLDDEAAYLKYKEKYNPEKGDILLCNIGTIGTSLVLNQDNKFLIAWNLFKLKINKELYEPKYIKYYLDKLRRMNYFDRLLTGGTVKFINKTKMGEIKIPICNIYEQYKIVEILDKAQELIDKRKEQLEALDELVKSRFIEMFGDLKNNSKHWVKLNFDEFAKINTSMTKDFEQYSNYPHIGIDSIEKNTGNILKYQLVKDSNLKSGKYLFDERHIIYSKIRPNLNKVALPQFKGLCSADAYPILCIDGITNRNYLGYVLRSEFFLNYILAFSGRTNIPKVNKEQLKGFIMPTPPIALQNQFATFVKQVDKLKFEAQKSLTEMENNFNSLMQRAFK